MAAAVATLLLPAAADAKSLTKIKNSRMCDSAGKCRAFVHGFSEKTKKINDVEVEVTGLSWMQWKGKNAYAMCIKDVWMFRASQIAITAPFFVSGFVLDFTESIAGPVALLRYQENAAGQFYCVSNGAVSLINNPGAGAGKYTITMQNIRHKIKQVIHEQHVLVYKTADAWNKGKPDYRNKLRKQITP